MFFYLYCIHYFCKVDSCMILFRIIAALFTTFMALINICIYAYAFDACLACCVDVKTFLSTKRLYRPSYRPAHSGRIYSASDRHAPCKYHRVFFASFYTYTRI